MESDINFSTNEYLPSRDPRVKRTVDRANHAIHTVMMR